MKKGKSLTTNNPDGKRDILADFKKNSKILSVSTVGIVYTTF
jgi:hypothetical protein